MLQPYVESGVPVARQQKILDTINANPLGSYVFSGPPGVGKTTLMREVERLARAACSKNHGVYSSTAMKYQKDATAVARGESVYGFMRPSTVLNLVDLRFRCSVFLDDMDKVSCSEFIRLQLFEFIDTICTERTPPTQLVMSTNMNRTEFSKFFGDAIAWRVFKHCVWVPMEREA